MVKLLQTDGIVQEVQPKNGETFSLKELQEFVGGYIELVTLPDDLVLVVNEEGLLHNLPYNGLAKLMFQRDLVGNILVCPRTMLN